ncbi:MAG: BMP family lipoprotein [Myxococcota bacterium]
MRRRLLLLAALLLANLVVAAVGMLRSNDVGEDKAFTAKVGLVFDLGGRGDKSFNDSAYRGLERALRELPIHGEYLEPGDGADRESAIRLLAARGFDLVIGVGIMFTDDVLLVARDYPDVLFACVDMIVLPDQKLPPNVIALKFREEEGSYLVGAAAGLATLSKTVGFIGGMDMPLIRKFEAGYRAGVKAVCPECKILSAYAGVTPEAFKDPVKGKELALAQFGRGADVLYHASGSTGLGAFEAARLAPPGTRRLVIGVDSDQTHEAPGHVLSSMVKRVDVAVFDTLKAVSEQPHRRDIAGVRVFGLAQDGVDYVADERNANLIDAKMRERIEALRRDIVAGRIQVPSQVAPAEVAP